MTSVLWRHFTSKFSTAPARIFCPAGGHWVTMMLAGVGCGGSTTIEIDGVLFAGAEGGGATLTVPSLKPASCSVRLALPCGCPTKLGITKARGLAAILTSQLVLAA